MNRQNEVILSIEEIENVNLKGEKDDEHGWDRHDGFKITTTEQEILLLISSYQSCCESWGYFMSEDDLDKFLAADLVGIEVTDTNRSHRHVFTEGFAEIKGDGREPIHLDSGDVMFVDIKTSVGTLQFTAYNAHNGYYGHSAHIVSLQLTKEVGL